MKTKQKRHDDIEYLKFTGSVQFWLLALSMGLNVFLLAKVLA
jgi:hypothetical protein